MKTTSWPLNYPKSDSWPPRRPLPVVNSYSNYPGLTVIIDCLTLTESRFNRKYNDAMVDLAYQILRDNIGEERYTSGDYDRGLLHPNNAITPFKRQAIINEFDRNLEPELRRLWRDLYQDVSTEDNVSILIDFSIASLRDSILNALTSSYGYDLGNNGYINLTAAGKSLSRKLAQARYLAESELNTYTPADYDQVIDKNYPNPPFRELGQDPEPFSRFILGKYPQVLFGSFSLTMFSNASDIRLESPDLECFTFKDAKAIARESIEEEVGNFSPPWLAAVTGLSVTIFNALSIAAEPNERLGAVRELVERTCGFDDLVDEAIADDGFNLWIGFENSNDDDLYRIFGRDYLVGEV